MIELLRLILHIVTSLFKPKSEARGRNPSPSPTAQRASPTGLEATTTQQYRSLSICLALSLVPFRPRRDCNSPPRDDHPLASRGVSVVLARAVTQAQPRHPFELRCQRLPLRCSYFHHRFLLHDRRQTYR